MLYRSGIFHIFIPPLCHVCHSFVQVFGMNDQDETRLTPGRGSVTTQAAAVEGVAPEANSATTAGSGALLRPKPPDALPLPPLPPPPEVCRPLEVCPPPPPPPLATEDLQAGKRPKPPPVPPPQFVKKLKQEVGGDFRREGKGVTEPKGQEKGRGAKGKGTGGEKVGNSKVVEEEKNSERNASVISDAGWEQSRRGQAVTTPHPWRHPEHEGAGEGESEVVEVEDEEEHESWAVGGWKSQDKSKWEWQSSSSKGWEHGKTGYGGSWGGDEPQPEPAEEVTRLWNTPRIPQAKAHGYQVSVHHVMTLVTIQLFEWVFQLNHYKIKLYCLTVWLSRS